MRDDVDNGHGGIAKEKKLVDAGDDHGPCQAEHPSAERHHGYGRIIGVGDRSADFGVWGIVVEFTALVRVEIRIVEIGRVRL